MRNLLALVLLLTLTPPSWAQIISFSNWKSRAKAVTSCDVFTNSRRCDGTTGGPFSSFRGSENACRAACEARGYGCCEWQSSTSTCTGYTSATTLVSSSGWKAAMCVAPAPCAPQTGIWSNNGYYCSADVPGLNHGETLTLNDSDGFETGSATAKCMGGTLTLSNTICSASGVPVCTETNYYGPNFETYIGSTTYSMVWGDGSRIYVTRGTQGISSYVFAGRSELTDVKSYNTAGTAKGVWGDGSYIYVADGSNGILALSFDGNTYTLSGHYDTPGDAVRIWGDGTYIYLADGPAGLHAFTFNGTTFDLKATFPVESKAIGVWGGDGYVHVADETIGVKALSFNGTDFTLHGTFATTGTLYSISGDGKYYFVANGTEGFHVLTYNGSNYKHVASVDTPGTVHHVWSSGFDYDRGASNPKINRKIFISDGNYFRTAFLSSTGSVNLGGSSTFEAKWAWGDGYNVYFVYGNLGLRTTYESCTGIIGNDKVPDPFSFTDINNASLNTQYISAGVTITGIDRPVKAQVTGPPGTYISNYTATGGGLWSNFEEFNPGDVLRIKMTSSSTPGTPVTATVTIEGVSATWTITTAP